MIQVRAHTRRKATNPKREAIHNELAIEPALRIMTKELQAELDDEMRALAFEFEPGLEGFPNDGGVA